MKISKEAIPELAATLHQWLFDVDNFDDVVWYNHVIEKDFKCGCRLAWRGDYPEDGLGREHCDYWRWLRGKVVDPALAYELAHQEKDRRYQNDWAQAIQDHRLFIANQQLYEGLRLAGEEFIDFMERLQP